MKDVRRWRSKAGPRTGMIGTAIWSNSGNLAAVVGNKAVRRCMDLCGRIKRIRLRNILRSEMHPVRARLWAVAATMIARMRLSVFA